jgi:multidrug efflux system outer membrane protein
MIKHIKLIVTPLALSMALAGCMSLAPDYERPAAPVASAFPAVPQAATASTSPVINQAPAAVAWQQFFADARLRQLIDQALVNNRDLRIAIANIEQARAQYRITRADRLPSVGLGVSGNRQTVGEDQPINSTYQAGLQVSSFELDLFGRVRNLSEAALAQYLATEEARKTTQISLIASVANAYLQLLADEELLRITQDTLKTRQDSDRLTQLRFENGVASRLDIQQSRSLVETALATLAQQQRFRAQDINLLTLLVGQPLPADVSTGATLAKTELPDLPAGLPSDLLANRPDIRAAEQDLIAANANIGAARANFFPRISLTASAGSASSELSGYEQSIQTAFREVADALAGQATYSEQLRAQAAVTEAEADRFNLSDLRFRSGAASQLDLLDAQRSLFQSQQLSVQANLLRLQNQVALYRVLGGGWVEPAAQADGTPVAAR